MAGMDADGDSGGVGVAAAGTPSERIHQRSTLGVQRAMPYSPLDGSERSGSKLLSTFSIAAMRTGETSRWRHSWAESTISRRYCTGMPLPARSSAAPQSAALAADLPSSVPEAAQSLMP